MNQHVNSILGHLVVPAFSALLLAGCATPVTTGHDHDEAVAEAHDELTAEQCDYFAVDGKVQVCHATGSASNPYKIIKIAVAGCKNGHTGHDGDYITSSDPASPLYDPTCSGGGCVPTGAPCDASLPCCDGNTCEGGVCVAPAVLCPCAEDPVFGDAWAATLATAGLAPLDYSAEAPPELTGAIGVAGTVLDPTDPGTFEEDGIAIAGLTDGTDAICAFYNAPLQVFNYLPTTPEEATACAGQISAASSGTPVPDLPLPIALLFPALAAAGGLVRRVVRRRGK